MLVTLFALLAAAAFACASPVSVNYPLDQQLPLVARTNTLYSWTFSEETFTSSDNAALLYTMSGPSWLSLDGQSRTLNGSPTTDDEGEPSVTITAKDPNSDASASCHMKLYVTSDPPPMLNISVAQQFSQHNPSLSSVFLLSTGSALDQPNPSLRVPPRWSFSIGFEYNTFIMNPDGDGDVYYGALQTNGSQLPHWVRFNPDEITFDGVTPPIQNGIPQTLSVALHASDRAGFSAASALFDIVITAHELSLSQPSLPTINVTADTPFNFSMMSPVDFAGVLIDHDPAQPSDIAGLSIDTAQYRSWLDYDSNSRVLSGTPPSELDGQQTVLLPVTLTSVVNQSLATNVSIAVVPSYFTTATLQPVLATPGKFLSYDLAQYFSNKTVLGDTDEIGVSAAFDPDDAASYLTFNTSSAVLSGWIPSKPNSTHLTVTFTAYSHLTHSTSHTSLPVSLSVSDFTKSSSKSSGLSAAARAKMLLGLKIAFGIISGLVVLGMSLAAFRRCAHVPDSALEGEAGQRAWTADEMKWYGIGIEGVDEKYAGPELEEGYGWADRAAALTKQSEALSEAEAGTAKPRTPGAESKYGALRRGASMQAQAQGPGSPSSPGMMRKAEFMSALRATARKVSDKYRTVSDKYRRGPRVAPRPQISKPVLLMASDQRVSGLVAGGSRARQGGADDLPFANGLLPPLPPTKTHIAVLPTFDDASLGQYAASALTSIVDSPSSSTNSRSIPRRRPDFAPPRAPALKTPPEAHLQGAHAYAARPVSAESAVSAADSLGSASSSRTHEREAVVQTATRATSVRSARSTLSLGAAAGQNQTETEAGARARLVPFTSANRVPVPKAPSAGDTKKAASANAKPPARTASANTGQKRIQSQTAKVFRGADGALADEGEGAQGGEDLRESIEYVRALGGDEQGVPPAGAGSHTRSSSASFSVESSHHGHERSADRAPPVPRMLARTGEQFRFRVPVAPSAAPSTPPRSANSLEVRLVSGAPLPRYMKADLDAAAGGKRAVELWGTPGPRDVGELDVGVYEKEGGACVGRVIVEVVMRS